VTPNAPPRVKVSDKDLQQIVDKAIESGWTVTYSRGNHLIFRSPDRSKPSIYTGSTPSDWRSNKNFKSTLKRHGLETNPMFPNAAKKTSRKAAPLKAKTELGIYNAVAAVRDAHKAEQLTFLPPGVVSKLKKLPAGLYKYGWGAKKGEQIVPFKKSTTVGGALTSMRIGSKASGEYHWLVDNHDKYPVVIRIVNGSGKTEYRVEEYAAKLKPHAMVAVERAKAKTSRMKRSAHPRRTSRLR